MWHAWGTARAHTGFQWRNLTEKDFLELGVDGGIILKRIFKKKDEGCRLD
jgi:hypothetical protein